MCYNTAHTCSERLFRHRRTLDDMSAELGKSFDLGQVKIRQQTLGPIVRNRYAN